VSDDEIPPTAAANVPSSGGPRDSLIGNSVPPERGIDPESNSDPTADPSNQGGKEDHAPAIADSTLPSTECQRGSLVHSPLAPDQEANHGSTNDFNSDPSHQEEQEEAEADHTTVTAAATIPSNEGPRGSLVHSPEPQDEQHNPESTSDPSNQGGEDEAGGDSLTVTAAATVASSEDPTSSHAYHPEPPDNQNDAQVADGDSSLYPLNQKGEDTLLGHESSHIYDPSADEEDPPVPKEVVCDGKQDIAEIETASPVHRLESGGDVHIVEDDDIDEEELDDAEEEGFKNTIRTIEDAKRLATIASQERFESVVNLPDVPDYRQVLLWLQ